MYLSWKSQVLLIYRIGNFLVREIFIDFARIQDKHCVSIVLLIIDFLKDKRENIERLSFVCISDHVFTSVFDIFVYFHSTCGNDFDIGAKAAKSFETHA